MLKRLFIAWSFVSGLDLIQYKHFSSNPLWSQSSCKWNKSTSIEFFYNQNSNWSL